ncbi:hypothetical protein [Paenibacillus paeoniae]|uniref:Lipoprotein n=1 Tax=Paenibacillus paeoniae TaxID=2292705 RepID=A0A371PJ72_9BACL|nr:hypothetical protein [Paenibacillus paeoniae]REK75975.1 hypothetical protein DX130_02565 [Paenibacillus paeoniae]
MKNKMKYAWLVGLAVLWLAGCTNSANDAEIRVKSESKTIDFIAEKGGGDGVLSIVDGRLFQEWVSDQEEIPYLKLGAAITIQLNKNISGSYELKDVLLKEDGALKYITQPFIEQSHDTVIDFDKGVGSFILTENAYAYLSSQSKDYEPGATIRGFQLYLHDKDETIAFVIRTDASSQSEA